MATRARGHFLALRAEASQFCSAEDTTAVMAFDGVIFLNGPLKIHQLKDCDGMEMLGPTSFHMLGVTSTNVSDLANKIFIAGLI